MDMVASEPLALLAVVASTQWLLATEDKHHVQISHNIIIIYQILALLWGRASLTMNSQDESGRKCSDVSGD